MKGFPCSNFLPSGYNCCIRQHGGLSAQINEIEVTGSSISITCYKVKAGCIGVRRHIQIVKPVQCVDWLQSFGGWFIVFLMECLAQD